MLRKLLSYTLIFTLAFISQVHEGPEFCDTLLNHEQISYELQAPNKAELPAEDKSAVVTLAITAHIVRNSRGKGGISEAAVLKAVEKMNEKYAGTNLNFEVCTFNYIDRNRLHYFNKTDEAALIKNNVDNTINLYFVNKIFAPNEGSICGYTYYPTKNQNHIILSNSCAGNETTLPHEMGHYFGLYHTHESKFGMELANGSNCSSAGDLVCDTSADPGLKFSNVNDNCEYIGLFFDPIKTVYNPPVTNIMSYSRKGCRKSFTFEQAEKMRENFHIFKKNLKVLRTNFQHSDPYLVKGQSLTLKASGGIKYEWNTGDSTDLLTITPDSTTTYSVNIYTEDGCMVHKEYQAQVISEDIFDAPEQVCKNTPAIIKVNHTKKGLRYRLMNGEDVIGAEIRGNDSTIVFETLPLKKSSEFTLKVINKDAKTSYDIKKKIKVGVTEIPDSARVKVIYPETVCNGSNPSIKIVNPSKGVYYQLQYKGLALHKPYKGSGDTLFIEAPAITQAASFDLMVFNDCNTFVKNEVVKIAPNNSGIPYFSMQPEKMVVNAGEATKIKIYPSSKDFTYEMVKDTEVVGKSKGNGEALIFKTGRLDESADYCLKVTDAYGCTQYVDKSILIAVNKDPELKVDYDDEQNPLFNYQLAINNFVKLELFEMRGKKLATIINGNQQPGIYNINLASSDVYLPPNNYMVKITVGDRKPEFKMFTIYKEGPSPPESLPFARGW